MSEVSRKSIDDSVPSLPPEKRLSTDEEIDIGIPDLPKAYDEVYRIDVSRYMPEKGFPALTPSEFSTILNLSYKYLYKLHRAGVKDIEKKVPGFLLLGPPGVGKSEVVKEVAKKVASDMGLEFREVTNRHEARKILNEIINGEADPSKMLLFLDLRLTEVELSDLMGIPKKVDVTDSKGQTVSIVEYTPPEWAYLLSVAPGILFLDELTNVKDPAIIAAAYKIVLDKMVGFQKLHPATMIVAAGNLPFHAQGLAEQLPAPLINRLKVYYIAPPTLREWADYMKNRLIEMRKSIESIGDRALKQELLEQWESRVKTFRIIFSYLMSKWREYGIDLSNRDADMNENFPSPRSWSKLVFVTSHDIYEKFLLETERNRDKALEKLYSHFTSLVGRRVAEELVPLFSSAVISWAFENYYKLADNPESAGKLLEELRRQAEKEGLRRQTKNELEIFIGSDILISGAAHLLGQMSKAREKDALEKFEKLINNVIDYMKDDDKTVTVHTLVSAIHIFGKRFEGKLKAETYKMLKRVYQRVLDFVESRDKDMSLAKVMKEVVGKIEEKEKNQNTGGTDK